MARGLKLRTVGTYTPYLGAFWQLCLARGAQLEDPALFRGFILAISRHANRKPSASTLQVVCSAIAALLGALALRSPLHDPATKHWLAVEMKTRARRKPKRPDAILSEQIGQAVAGTLFRLSNQYDLDAWCTLYALQSRLDCIASLTPWLSQEVGDVFRMLPNFLAPPSSRE